MNRDISKTRSLSKQQCLSCQAGTKPLVNQEVQELLKQLDADWRAIDDRHIERDFKFGNFKDGLEFVNKVGHLAQEQGHHPEVFLKWSKVTIILRTHKIGGLSKNDFIFAAKIDEMTK